MWAMLQAVDWMYAERLTAMTEARRRTGIWKERKMTMNNEDVTLADIADGALASPDLEAWLLSHPDQAAEVAAARRVRLLLAELRTVPVTLPADFEARLMERVRRDVTFRDLLDLWLAGWGRVLLELLDLLFSGPAARDPAATR